MIFTTSHSNSQGRILKGASSELVVTVKNHHEGYEYHEVKEKTFTMGDTEAARRELRDPADFSAGKPSGNIRRMFYLDREEENDGCINIPQ